MMIKGKSLKIILAIEKPGPGGTERQVIMLAKYLIQKDHTVSVIMTNYSHHCLEDEHGHYFKESEALVILKIYDFLYKKILFTEI